MKAKKLTELALLTTAALIIFIIELRIPNPIPIPGVKMGLANIITVYAVYHYRPKEVLMIVFVRVLMGAIFGGSVMAFAYSMSGSIICLLGMLPLKKIIPENRIWLCSIFGAVLHNLGQIGAAVIIMRTFSAAAYFPFLLVSGCVTGLFTGVCAQFIIRRSRLQGFNGQKI